MMLTMQMSMSVRAASNGPLSFMFERGDVKIENRAKLKDAACECCSWLNQKIKSGDDHYC